MTKPFFSLSALLVLLLLAGGCRETESGPIRVSAIGGPPRLVNPNLEPTDPPTAYLVEAVAQGLVRFDAAGDIEPALAQSWIISDDGLRYTFRIRRTHWSGGRSVTAEQVTARLRAAMSRASRNPLKPVLASIENVVAMTDQVLEVSLRGPRPYQLQLFAQPEMAIILNNQGTGPYVAEPGPDGAVRLSPRRADEDEAAENEALPDVALRGERAAAAIARFAAGETDLVTGGTLGDLPLARAARQPANRLVLDPTAGLFGLSFAAREGPLTEPAVRRALSMAIDRGAIAAALSTPALQPRTSLAPAIAGELAAPAQPDWAAAPMPMRRQNAAQTIAALGEPLRVRVSMPDGPGYRLLFAFLRRDWRLIGVEAERVRAGAPADLHLIDAVAPELLASWYLRHFTCRESRVCDPAADQALDAAQIARTAAERQGQLVIADQILNGVTPFIPLGSPVRWSLVSPRLTGFRPNAFGRHSPGTLIAEEF